MRVWSRYSIYRQTARLLIVTTLLTMLAPGIAIADDAILVERPGHEQATAEQAALPAPSPIRVLLQSSTEFVEDPTRLAGGEDDAQRANEQQVDRQQNDDGDPRRK